MTGGAYRRWNVSIALRVAGRASVDRFHPAILPVQFEALPFPVHGDAALPPVIPGVPPAAKMPVWCDVPLADIVPCATIGRTFECAIQHAVWGQGCCGHGGLETWSR